MAAVLSQGPLTSRLDLEQTILFGIATLKLKSLLVDQSAQGGPVQKPHGLPGLALLPQSPNGCGDLLRHTGLPNIQAKQGFRRRRANRSPLESRRQKTSQPEIGRAHV